jgi:hypothetical protein
MGASIERADKLEYIRGLRRVNTKPPVGGGSPGHSELIE